MIYVKRSRLSPREKNEIWGRWKAGQSLHAIGRAYWQATSTIGKLLLPRGGIAPAPRRRSLTWDRGLKNQKFLSSERRPTLVTGLP
jgi:hypothetical protein